MASPHPSARGSRLRLALSFAAVLLAGEVARTSYLNFEVSHVHPVDLTPSGSRLLAVNTPDALLEVFAVQADGSLVHEAAIPVGLEPVTVAARTEGEVWVVNHLSDSVSIVDLDLGAVVDTLVVGDEPTDVVFAGGKAFVAVSTEDAVKVYALSDLSGPPTILPLFSRDVRALAVSNDGEKVYAVTLRSGNRTSVVNANVAFGNNDNLNPSALTSLGLTGMKCSGPPPPYPPLPDGIERNPALTDPPPSANPAEFPPVGLIVRWEPAGQRWLDEAGGSWSHCLKFRLPDQDLFIIDVADLTVDAVPHLGTSLFDVSVNPANGRVYVPNTDARNFVRFEHPLGLRGHVVENQLSVVDPAALNAVTIIDLNAHIDRGSDPATNLVERMASISQPGMLTWKSDGSAAFLTATGSRKLFRVDGKCLEGGCIFGPVRSAPAAVEVGEGPTGVVLREATNPDAERLYVLNRASHSVSVVRASTLDLLAEVPLHDPSSEDTRLGRRFLYEAIDASAHGDTSCASCHISGDMDGLAWDLGNPAGEMVPYSTPFDNVRFITATGGGPDECTVDCAAHEGFDPQKGPMVTTTLRAMLEPLHWRGDRPTMNDFNATFVDLMGARDIGPVNGKPAGLTAEDVERFRQFTLSIAMPPNPFRNVDDSTPCGPRALDPNCEVQVHGQLVPGNPTEGFLVFGTSQGDTACLGCHDHPFGAAGGKLGGVEPAEPTAVDAAGLRNGSGGVEIGVPHSDIKVSHLRNMYDKFGPVWAAPGGPPAEAKAGFGFTHDGSIPDMTRLMAASEFDLDPSNQEQKRRDLESFLFHFSTGVRAAVGRQVTVPPGTPPTGSPQEEGLISALTGFIGDLASPIRHCELVASAKVGGRPRQYHYDGSWVADIAGEPALTTIALRQQSQSPITFTCVTLGSGLRLGGDRDEDGVLNGEDCAPADAQTLGAALTVSGVAVAQLPVTTVAWNDQSGAVGSSIRYDALGGSLSALSLSGIEATACLASGLEATAWEDPRPDPTVGEGFYYLIRARNPCGTAALGPGREALQSLECP